MATKNLSSYDIKKEKLDDITTCCICTEVYTDPKVLPCIHTFCMKCIQETGLKSNKGPGDEMPCPICRQMFKIPTEGFHELSTNFFIERLIQVSKVSDPSAGSKALCSMCLEQSYEQEGKEIPTADTYCVECKYELCDECCRQHRKFKPTKNHQLMPIDEYESGQKEKTNQAPSACELHRQRILDVFCTDCKTVVCAICFIADHKYHEGSHVNKFVDGFRKQIENNAEAINECRVKAQMKQEKLLEVKKDTQKRVIQLQCDVANRTDELKQLIDKHATSLLQGLSSIKQSKLKEIQLATDDIETYLSSLESYNSFCQKIMTKGSASDICRAFSDLSVRVVELQQQCKPVIGREVQPIKFHFRKSELDECLERNGDNLIGGIEEVDLKSEKRSTQRQFAEQNMETGHEAPKKPEQKFISPSLTKQQRSKILQKMKSFRFPKVTITNCTFEDDSVEFYFVLEGISSIEKSLLASEIIMFLNVDASFAERIRVTQLKSKPTGQRTHSGPGNPIININAQSMTTLGAFVSIEGIGDHLLSCGHDKHVGDILSNDNNEIIGKTQAVAWCVEDFQSYDAAVANVDIINYTKSVAYDGRQLHLSATPVDPVKGTVVQRFPPQPMASRATIRHTDYNSLVHDVYGCTSVITDNREDFHRPGESGLVVTSLPSAEFPETVDPIGMLFFREFIEKTDDGRGYYLSLAIPITKNLSKLQEDEYCGRRHITFLRDT